jgi:hypothetical protein
VNICSGIITWVFQKLPCYIRGEVVSVEMVSRNFGVGNLKIKARESILKIPRSTKDCGIIDDDDNNNNNRDRLWARRS